MISFVIPAFNCAKTLRETVESIVAQDLDPYEVVIVDDASSDATPAVLTDLVGRHPAVRWKRNTSNRGGGATRNVAISQAHGDILYMVDSDNVLPPDIVEAQLAVMQQTGLEAASVEALRFFSDDIAKPTHEWQLVHVNGRSGIGELFASTRVPASHGNYLFTRRLFDSVRGYDEDVGAADAWVFGMKHVTAGFDVAIARDTFYFHRAGHESYWIREARHGRNDVHALRAVQRRLNVLPANLRERVAPLREGDPFLEYIDAGLLAGEGEAPGALLRAIRRRRVQRRQSRP